MPCRLDVSGRKDLDARRRNDEEGEAGGSGICRQTRGRSSAVVWSVGAGAWVQGLRGAVAMALGSRHGMGLTSHQRSRERRTRNRDPREARVSSPRFPLGASQRIVPKPGAPRRGSTGGKASQDRAPRPRDVRSFPFGRRAYGEPGPRRGGTGRVMQGSKQRVGLYPWGGTPAAGDPRPHTCCVPVWFRGGF